MIRYHIKYTLISYPSFLRLFPEVLQLGHKTKSHHKKKKKTQESFSPPENSSSKSGPSLELVVKGDTDGSDEAVCQSLFRDIASQDISVKIIRQGVGDINKTDILTAAGGSKLVLGFNVDVLPKLTDLCKEQDVEIRLYSIIYKLIEDIKEITQSLIPQEETEGISGSAKVIALFKSNRKGIILGCEGTEGKLQTGDRFRVISGMGQIYSGTIQSLHIEKDTVVKALPGQQVGVKIENFNKAKIGDIVECFFMTKQHKRKTWQPSGKVLKI